MPWCHFAKGHYDIIILYLLLILLILVNLKSPLQPQFLTDFGKQGCILKLRIYSFQPCIICEDPWWFTYESQNLWYTMIKFAFFFQSTLVEYIGVCTDTNKGFKLKGFAACGRFKPHGSHMDWKTWKHRKIFCSLVKGGKFEYIGKGNFIQNTGKIKETGKVRNFSQFLYIFSNF